MTKTTEDLTNSIDTLIPILQDLTVELKRYNDANDLLFSDQDDE